MVRRLLASVLVMFLFGVALQTHTELAFAQNASSSAAPYSVKFYEGEVANYNEAVKSCDTPSLECLVRNVTRFVAIEWVNNIVGNPDGIGYNQTTIPDPNAGSALPHRSTIAQGNDGGILGGAGRLIGSMYAYQPASGGRYVADVLDNAGFAQPAYAQGIGFASLDPVLSLWKMFRNVAYFFFIGAFIVIGFLIMFRQKVGSTAITAQQALPSIIISLILVTFSYAISGFLIDIMYLSMYLIVGVFTTVGDGGVGNEVINWNIVNLGWYLISEGGLQWNENMDLVSEIVANIGGDGAIAGTVGVLGGLTLSIVLAIAILIGVVKLFIELLKSYASILMSVIFSPLYLMMGAFPGKNPFMGWIKNLIANLAAFPTVLLFAIIFKVFIDRTDGTGNGGFMPPYLIGSGQANVAGHIVGLAILLALPEIVKEVKKKLGATDGFGSMVMSTAGKRLGTGADLGTPLVFGGAEGIRRGATGGFAALRNADRNAEYRGARGLWKGITEGYQTSKNGKQYVVGGAKHGLSQGFRVGQRVRKSIDDLQDGRLFEPDNLRAQLERIERGQRGSSGKKEEPAAPEPPKPASEA